VSWISNIRGASNILNLRNITNEASAGMTVIDFDKDNEDDILSINQHRQEVYFYKKSHLYHKPIWDKQLLFGKNNLTELMAGEWEGGKARAYRITSVIADDINYDGLTDLVVGVDMLIDGEDRTILVRAI
jgi:hypothetical protein